MKNLRDKINQIPKLPGVYLFKNFENTIIYIGKAINLYNRVNSYFTKLNDVKTSALVKKIKDIDFFVTNNEIEALLLENNLIKQYQPKYNIKLRDSKSYPMLKITNEEFPKIIRCREKRNDKDEYYGPFVNVQTVKNLEKIFTKVLNIRTCSKPFKKPYRTNPCLNFNVGNCSGPCAANITKEEYLNSINMARDILKGKVKNTINILKEKMEMFSKNQEFELAAKTRDQIKMLEELKETQIVDTDTKDNNDYIGIYSDFNIASIVLIRERNGKIIGKENYFIPNLIDYNSVLIDFLNAYYLNISDFPEFIFIQEDYNSELLINALKIKYKTNIKIQKPVHQKHKKILLLAKENAEVYYEEKKIKLEMIDNLRELKKVLNLEKLPRIIEGIDIATLHGKYNVGALVSFIDGKRDLKNYRQYNIEKKNHPDDYYMIEEVTARRYQKIKNENLRFPDLILIDGGKGQISSCNKILKILNLNIPVIGLTKKNEYIYQINKSKPIILPQKSLALKLLQQVRDEAHRFSNIRLSRKYKNETLESKLSSINGVGKKRLNALIKTFGSIEILKKTELKDIANMKGIGEDLAKKIYEFLH